MKTCAIVGINWGDEGKGRMVDLLTSEYDIVIRCQGGGNAGHTVINEKGKFALHLLPSGIFREGVVNILGNGVALDLENLWIEMEDVRSCRGTDNSTAWKRPVWRTRNTVPQSRASRRSIPINTRKRPSWRANCCIRRI